MDLESKEEFMGAWRDEREGRTVIKFLKKKEIVCMVLLVLVAYVSDKIKFQNLYWQFMLKNI